MRNQFFFTLAALSMCGVLAAQGNRRPEFAPGQIIVQERAGANAAAVEAALASVGGKLFGHIRQTKHHVVKVPEGQVDKIMAALLQTGLFSVAERDGRAYAVSTPNDPSFYSQWHLTDRRSKRLNSSHA